MAWCTWRSGKVTAFDAMSSITDPARFGERRGDYRPSSGGGHGGGFSGGGGEVEAVAVKSG